MIVENTTRTSIVLQLQAHQRIVFVIVLHLSFSSLNSIQQSKLITSMTHVVSYPYNFSVFQFFSYMHKSLPFFNEIFYYTYCNIPFGFHLKLEIQTKKLPSTFHILLSHYLMTFIIILFHLYNHKIVLQYLLLQFLTL